MQTSVKFAVNSETFSCEGKILKSAGFTNVMHWQAIQPDESLPPFEKGQKCDIKEVAPFLFNIVTG